MRDELLAYLLGDLSPQEKERISERLQNDPIWQRELETLEACLKSQEADSESNSLPADLVDRTCSLVKRATHHGSNSLHDSLHKAQASLTESHEGAVSPRRWSLADLTIAAGVLMALGMLLLPAVRESRDAARRLKCQNNLKNLGTALVEYSERYGQGLPHIELGENAGSFVLDLAESNLLSREALYELLVCPSSPLADAVFAGSARIHIPTQQQLDQASPEMLALVRKWMAGSYAFRIGYRDKRGRYRHVEFSNSPNAPMLADAPSISVAGFQSPNHGCAGQFVVFQDLSVRYFKQCSPNENTNFFLNDDHQHAAGRHIRDVVLARSEADPAGVTHAEKAEKP